MIVIDCTPDKPKPYEITSNGNIMELFIGWLLDKGIAKMTPYQEKALKKSLNAKLLVSYKVMKKTIVIYFSNGDRYIVLLSRIDHLNQILRPYGYTIKFSLFL